MYEHLVNSVDLIVFEILWEKEIRIKKNSVLISKDLKLKNTNKKLLLGMTQTQGRKYRVIKRNLKQKDKT